MQNRICENINKIKAEIEHTCAKCSRKPENIKLLAVSKYFPAEDIITLYNHGHRFFAENKAQELRDKIKVTPEDIEWHFIGSIQTNKIKYLIPNVSLIHSVSREKEIAEISKKAVYENIIQDFLIEVNISGEESKSGLNPDKVKKFADYCNNLKNIRLKGFMTMAPFDSDEKELHKIFGSLRNMRDEFNSYDKNITELSMGMSGDFKIALEEGATILRIGSSIFGTRNY